jgi:hypothetical protein
MRYVVGGGGTNHPWLFPLTHSKLSVVVRKVSKQTIPVQALNHIVLTSLNRSSGCGVERCLICITKYCTTSAVVVIRCLPLNYCERNGGCHLTSSSRLSHVGRYEGTGLGSPGPSTYPRYFSRRSSGPLPFRSNDIDRHILVKSMSFRPLLSRAISMHRLAHSESFEWAEGAVKGSRGNKQIPKPHDLQNTD